MGKTENSHVHDFGIFGRVPEPPHQDYLFQKFQGKSKSVFEIYDFYKFNDSNTLHPYIMCSQFCNMNVSCMQVVLHLNACILCFEIQS